MRGLAAIYLMGAILLLALSTNIDRKEKIGLRHILLAAFGWPIFAPVFAFRVWSGR